MRQFTFRGFMVPVFTIFNDDELQSVNYSVIKSYAKYLKEKGLEAVLVNGTTGEGTSLTCDERKRVTEIWSAACSEVGLKLMVQIGGTCFKEVVELIQHAEKSKVDAVLCLPELYFKPKTIEELVEYLKNVAKFAPEMPLFYYHIPMFTDLMFSMADFMDLAEKEIPSFQGIKYTSDDLSLLPASRVLKPNRGIFIGSDVKLYEAAASGFDSYIMTTLNICPEIGMEVVAQVKKGDHDCAKREQEKLTENVKRILVNGSWTKAMKIEFVKCGLPFKIGAPRKPL